MIRLQKIALLTSILGSIPRVSPAELRALWPHFSSDPGETLQWIALNMKPELLEEAKPRMDQLQEVESKLDAMLESGIDVKLMDEEHFPLSWMNRLGKRCPLYLYCSGDMSIFSQKLLGLVGSRDVDERGQEFTRSVARHAVELGLGIVSGCARGVDRIAMETGLESGRVAGICADSLAQTVKRYRQQLREGNLVLVSPYHPNATFSVGNAMGRNKLIYASSEWTIAVQSARGSGGTWSGALEALENGYGRVAAWNKGGDGNRGLIEKGAHLIESADDLNELLSTQPTSLF